MSRRLVLGAGIAFCAALVLGRYVFNGASQPQVIESEPLAAVSAASVSSPAVTSPEIEQAKALSEAMRAQRSGNTDLTPVDGGVKNENIRLTHFISNESLEGSLHKVQGGFGETLRWLPQTQQLRRGQDVAAILSTAQARRGEAEKVGEINRFVYKGTYQNTDERMYVRRDGGMEHDYVLSRPMHGVDNLHDLAFTGVLQLPPGLTLWDDEGKQITTKRVTGEQIKIKNVFNHTVFCLRRPVAFDANVTKPDGTLDAKKQGSNQYLDCLVGLQYHVDFNESGVELAVVAPGRWLSDPKRAFPVVIDPNLGPFGLADGDPPVYVGSQGSDTLIPASAGGALLPIVARAGDAGICTPKLDNGYGIIAMPFAFTYYGVLRPAGAPLFVHIDGFASWQCPWETCLPLVPPATSACFDTDNTPLPAPGYPWDAMFPYWDDLKFGPGPNGNDRGSGIYFFTEGIAPNRRLVIEWHKMGYAGSPNPTDIISFNLVLYECENRIQFIIGTTNDVDLQRSSVGIENRSGSLGIQFCFNGGLVDPPLQPITPGTSLNFQPSRASTVSVTPAAAAGCIPLEVCFNTTVTPPPSNCGTGPSVTPSLAFRWIFDFSRMPANTTLPDTRLDRGEAFTPNVCHTFVTPGRYQVALELTDEFGTRTRITRNVDVCDKPEVVISAEPQGGYAPLDVIMEARTPSDPNILLTGSANWNIERLGINVEPGQAIPEIQLVGNVVTYTFNFPGIYRVLATFSGTDQNTGLQTSGSGVIFIFVADPADQIEDGIVITESKLKVDWRGKADGPDADGLPPNTGSTTPGQGLPDAPDNDTLYIKGIINLPGITQSALAGRQVRVIVNGVFPIFEGILDANGTATNGDQATGRIATFSIKQPSGNFFCSSKGNLYGHLALTNLTERRLLPVHYRVEIQDLFPTAQLGPIITYDYASTGFKSAKGAYKFGMFTKEGFLSGKNLPPTPQNPNPTPGVPAGTGKPGGQTLLVSGAFMVTDATVKLEGSLVSATLKGFLSRFGGDDLRPAANSDVVISLGAENAPGGGYSEALNFTTTATFKTSGKAPSQKFSFKRDAGLGVAGITSFQWANRAGLFTITANALSNDRVLLNPAADVQNLVLGLIITPENAQQFNARARFAVIKKSPTEFVRSAKSK
ncbi:MAG TPA: PKD domain-containing protein [Planctomycetota bacterium]|nr:PKD domain-containing protein [Planctomycetota bacterium]